MTKLLLLLQGAPGKPFPAQYRSLLAHLHTFSSKFSQSNIFENKSRHQIKVYTKTTFHCTASTGIFSFYLIWKGKTSWIGVKIMSLKEYKY